MWLFSETGFVSAVAHRDDKNKFIVRGRDKQSLEPLAKFARTKIIEGGGTDYPFRVFVSKKKFTEWTLKQIENLEYTNYKSRMYTTRGPEFCDALHDVWSDMQQVSPKKGGKVGYAGRDYGKVPQDWWE